MRGLDAPLPSRWASILLRRALMSRLAAPAGVDPVDWVAERADLLLRMGEADAARMLVQSVDDDDYTPRMIEVAAQAALATADPSGLCPVAGPAPGPLRRDVSWLLAEAMCAGLESEAARASALIDQARNQGATGIDLALAEKVIGASGETRRAAAVEWEQVPDARRLAARPRQRDRHGDSGAADGPARVPRMRAWFARAPMMAPETRADAAETAAALGVFSSRALVELHSLIFDRTDVAERGDTVGARLREAWTARRPDRPGRGDAAAVGRDAGRAGALWPADPHRRRGGADRAVVRLSRRSCANLIAAMFSAGLDRQAARWADIVEAAGDQRAWAMLAVGAPQAGRGRCRSGRRLCRRPSRAGAASCWSRRSPGSGRLDDGAAPAWCATPGSTSTARDAWSQALDAAAHGAPAGHGRLAGRGRHADRRLGRSAAAQPLSLAARAARRRPGL